MRNVKLSIIILLGLAVLLTAIGFSLALPDETLAHPSYGFTPEPPPDGGGGGGSDGGGGDDDDSPPETPLEYVLVRLDQCDIDNCPVDVEMAGTGSIDQLLASVASDTILTPLVLSNAPMPFEIQVPVQLVHESSGWISEAMLSTHADTRIAVPYPGQWQVLVTGPPQFVTANAVDTASTNLAQLQTDVADAPVLLGIVETNTASAQLVRCPLQCVIETPATPAYLPETGNSIQLISLTTAMIVGILMSLIGGLTVLSYQYYKSIRY